MEKKFNITNLFNNISDKNNFLHIKKKLKLILFH